MTCKFLDLQNEDNNPYHQIQADLEILNEVFEFSKQLDPYICEFIHNNGYKLTVGIGATTGCAQFCSIEHMPPYLISLSDPSVNDQECEEFLLGGTATEISKRNCIEISLLKKVVQHFFETGERLTDIDWEEI